MRDPMSFEVVNYATPVPRNKATLTALGIIFDRVYFPGVNLPTEGYDQKTYHDELHRLMGLGLRDWNTSVLIGVMGFIQHVQDLRGFCVFTGPEKSVFGEHGGDPSQELLKAIELATYGPRRPGWEPIIETGYTKALSEKQWFSYPGDLHYRAAAILEANSLGLPLINDDAAAPVADLVSGEASPTVSQLATMLAAHAVTMVLPGFPILSPPELMEFREKNAAEMRTFRASMLRHAAVLKEKLGDANEQALQREIENYISGTVAPDLEALRSLAAKGRSLGERMKDAITMVATFGAGYVSGGVTGAILAAGAQVPGIVTAEIAAHSDRHDAKRDNGLYYLLKVDQVRV